MPIPLTKYNKVSALEKDLSNNSYVYNNYILTCDISDTVTNDNGTLKTNRIYLTTKANHLIHPFSKVSNCVSKFDSTNNVLFQYKAPAQCHSCVDVSSSITNIATQKKIQKQVGVAGSLYTMNLGSLNINSDDLANGDTPWHNSSDRRAAHGAPEYSVTSLKGNKGVDIKHNSYDRYLGRKKSQHLKTQTLASAATNPQYGNKVRTFGLINCVRSC